ncbi:MAG TPA: hypothetical protein VKU19_29130 [Bryobacteraceae bacterium]|nr:hypothetical protein [Bryobacteraceae bacterium]
MGNFGSGQIAAFNAESGKFQSMMNGDGLRGLKFGNGNAAGPAKFLFFAAGIQAESHGLFGTLAPLGGKDGDTGQDKGQDD